MVEKESRGALEVEITKIEKRNLAAAVQRQMAQMIDAGEWKEGDKLASENSLAEQLGVSRIVIREALQGLRSQHKILTRQGMGSFVCNPNNFLLEDTPCVMQNLEISEEEFLSLCELRRCLEYRAIALSVTKAADEDYAAVKDALEQMRLSGDDTDRMAEADFNFHLAILKCSHSPLLIKAFLSCRDEIYTVLHELNRLRDSASFGVQNHTAIFDALLRKDPKTAQMLLSQSNRYNRARYARMFREQKRINP